MLTSVECRTCTGAAQDLFSCLMKGQRSQLVNAAVPHTYRPQESLFYAGTPALVLYCVRSGFLKLFRRLSNGEKLVVGVRGPGDLLGLRGVLAGTTYVTTATALDTVVVCAIPGQDFMRLVRENSTMGYRLLQRLARGSRLLEDQLVERTHDRVGKRTARFLLKHVRPAARVSTPTSVGIVMSREEMAQLIGTTPETLSRTLHRFAADGILEVGRKEIHVLDLTALLHLAK
jgi:CRP-like cAMP-binding protein